MKILVISVLALLGAFALADVARVASLWNDYKPEHVLAHFSFAIGILTIVAFNLQVVRVGTFSSFFSQVKLLLSFLGQLAAVVLFSNLTIWSWIGCKPCTDSEVLSHRYISFGVLVFLFLLFLGLIHWSRKLAMPPSVNAVWGFILYVATVIFTGVKAIGHFIKRRQT
jgi:hypothetical protein